MKSKNSVLIYLILVTLLCCTGCKQQNVDNFTTPNSSNQNMEVAVTSEEMLPTQLPQEITYTPEIPTSTPIGEFFLPGDSMVLILGVVDHVVGYYQVNLDTGEFRLLLADGKPVFEVYNWLEDSCELVVSIADSGPIVNINLDGQITSVIYSESLDLPTGELSPDNKYFAYIVGSGYRDYFRYEVQDLLIRDLGDDINLVYQMSTNGGVWDFEWSPDGSMIAYTDYDDFGIMQLYVSNLVGTNLEQISNNKQSNLAISEIRWSTEGEGIAYQLENKENYSAYIIVHNFSDPNTSKIEYGPYTSISDFWWHSDNEIGIFYSDDESRNTWKITWYQAFDGKLINSLGEIDTPSQNIVIPKSLKGTNSIGYFNQNRNVDSIFYIYDFKTDTFSSFQNIEAYIGLAELRNWYPAIIIGNESCFSE
ncbi:hypothetical protein KQH40_00665 [bacterium]|nr:hypothetical protein [bacterium]